MHWRCDRGPGGRGGTAPRISSQPFNTVPRRLTDEVGQESLWTKMFADDIAICSGSREAVEGNLER